MNHAVQRQHRYLDKEYRIGYVGDISNKEWASLAAN